MREHAERNNAQQCYVDQVQAKPPTVRNDLPIGHQERTGQSKRKDTARYDAADVSIRGAVGLIQQKSERQTEYADNLGPVLGMLAPNVPDTCDLIGESRKEEKHH